MYPSNPYFSHSAKGTTWGKHKYIRKENGRYVYPSDLEKKRKGQTSSEYQQEMEYNSRRNGTSNASSSSGSSLRSKRKADPSKMSQEYREEMGYSTPSSNKSSSSKPNSSKMSNEYQKESAYNSKKNSYRVGTSSQNTKKRKVYPQLDPNGNLVTAKLNMAQVYNAASKNSSTIKEYQRQGRSSVAATDGSKKKKKLTKIDLEKKRKEAQKKKGQEYMKKTLKKRVGR